MLNIFLQKNMENLIAGWGIFYTFATEFLIKGIQHDRNLCKAQFRVSSQDRYELRADTFGCYPTCKGVDRQPLGEDS